MSCANASGAFTDLYVDCANLKVTGTLTVTGKFVARGDVTVTNGGCLVLGSASTLSCGALPAYISTPAPDDGENAYIAGSLEVAGGLTTRQVFLYVGLRITMNPDKFVYMAGPYGASTLSSPACTPATNAMQAPSPSCFENLALWSPYSGSKTQKNTLTGSAKLRVDGTLFMPNVYFNFAGSSGSVQERAQFVARSLNVTGGGLLEMTPDPSRSTAIPGVKGRLIR